MTKDEALRIALEALQAALEALRGSAGPDEIGNAKEQARAAITAIKQALAVPTVQPVGIKGYAMALNEVALQLRDRYKTDLLSTPLWAEFEKARNKFASSVATPPAQPAPVQEPTDIWFEKCFRSDTPAAQRQWVGLTDDEMYLNCPNWLSREQCKTWVQQIEAKLKEKNNGN